MAGGAVAVSGAVGVPEGIGRLVAPTMTVGTVVAGAGSAVATANVGMATAVGGGDAGTEVSALVVTEAMARPIVATSAPMA